MTTLVDKDSLPQEDAGSIKAHSESDLLERLTLSFRAGLAARLAALEAGLASLGGGSAKPADIDALALVAHSLAGAAGTFGLSITGRAAREFELALIAAKDDPAKLGSLPRVMAALKTAAENELASSADRESPKMGETGPHIVPKRSLDVLIIEDSVEQAEVLRHVLEAAGHRVEIRVSIETVRSGCKMGRPAPDVVIADLVFPEGDDAGIRLIDELHSVCLGDAPVIFTSVRRDFEARLKAIRAGGKRYFVKPVDPAQILTAIEQLTNRTAEGTYRALVVDDDPEQLEFIAAVLRAAGFDVRTESNPMAVFDIVADWSPDILIADVVMPECSGTELAAVLRDDENFGDLPILLISADDDVVKNMKALGLAGDGFLKKPVDPAGLVAAALVRARRFRGRRELTRRLEHMVREREQEHLALDQHAIVSIADVAGRILHVNEKFCEISGFRPDQLLGKTHRVVKSDVHPHKFYQEMWKTISSGRVWRGEVCNRRADGSYYWVHASIVPFVNEAGKPYQYVSIRTDITALKESQRALTEGEERFRMGQEFARIGTWDWNISTGALFWSNLIPVLFGYPKGKLETSYENFLRAVHPDDRDLLQGAVRRCLEEGADYDIEHRCLWPDGTVRWLHEKGDVIRDTLGRPVRMIGMVQDITERKRAQEELKNARQIAETANRAKSDFLSNMSHELRTPLNAIFGFAQLLMSGKKDVLTDRQKKYVDQILKGGNHLLDLINEILDLAKIESGRLELSIEPIDMEPLLEECMSLVEPLGEKYGVIFKPPRIARNVCPAKADRVRTKQVLLNLLSNAAKYNRRGGTVIVEVTQDQGHLVISVVDTGAGIPDEKVDQLFVPFSRLGQETGDIEGTGIGLALSQKLVRQMEGGIGVSSQVGEGSTFWFTLPTGPLGASNLRRLKGSEAGTSAELADELSITMLYVEDNPANLALMEEIVDSMGGIRLVSATTAAQGLDLARASPPQIIIMDINLPGMDGFEALREIQTDSVLASIPVIALSANANPGVIARGRDAGFVEYLTKPIQIDLFTKVVFSALKRGKND